MNPQVALADWLGSVSDDPYAYVMGAFPWGEAGTRLANEAGPYPWQKTILHMIRDWLAGGGEFKEAIEVALRLAVASGNGIGKSSLVSWIIKWAMDTRPDTRGVVTANTEPQLKTKTWAELGKWHAMSLTKDVFKQTATSYFHPDHERTWRCDAIPWNEHNPEAFSGLHNKGGRAFLIMDEASGIHEVIWEFSNGLMTDADTQLLWCAFGNPNRNTGGFADCFGRLAKRWHHWQIDSRTVPSSNKKELAQWIEDYGLDSDFVRIRILGQFPKHGEMEFFRAEDVDAAMLRDVSVAISDPLAIGVDVARFGSNSSVIYPRKGRDARSIPRERFQGLSTVELAQKVFSTHSRLRSDGIFVDGGGVGGGVVDNLRHMHLFVYEVQFGAKADHLGFVTGTEGERYANKRAEIYGMLRGWLRTGAIPNDPALREQLLSITYTHNNRDEILLTSKEQMMRDGKPSPDDVDALAETFAVPLNNHAWAGGEHLQKPQVEHEYDPFSEARLVA
jgi:hypothetical protein